MLSGIKIYNDYKEEIDFKIAKAKLLGINKSIRDFVTDKAFELTPKYKCLELDLTDLQEDKLSDLCINPNRDSALLSNDTLLLNTTKYQLASNKNLGVFCSNRVNSLFLQCNTFSLTDGCNLQEFCNSKTLYENSVYFKSARCKIDNCFNNQSYDLVQIDGLISLKRFEYSIMNSFNHCRIKKLVIRNLDIPLEINLKTCFRLTSVDEIVITDDSFEASVLENRLKYMRGKSYV